MKSRDYWKERMSALNEENYRKSAAYYEDVRKQYQKAIRDMERDILVWYERIADNNGISLANAKKLLKADELEEFHWTVQDYIEAGEANAVSGQWMKQLENASAKYHISRLEAMRIQLQQQAELIAAQFEQSLEEFLGELYEEQSYHIAYEIAAGTGIGRSFERINPRTIEQVLAKPWAQDGKVFSERIWTNRDKLVQNLHTILSQGIVRGTAPQRMIADLSHSMEVSRSQAANLILTETAAISARATQDTYKELDVEEFEVLETLDSRTCSLCADMDGKHFPQKDYQIGVTVPPFHPRCRGTTVPYFDDEFTEGEMRAARDENDKGYELVPADLTYRDWEERFVRERKTGLQGTNPSDKIKTKEKILQKHQMSKLQEVMPEDDFNTYFQLLLDNTTSDIDRLYAKFTDECNQFILTADRGSYAVADDVVKFHFESEASIDEGLNKFDVLGHECGHMFDTHIGRKLNANFTEIDAINSIGKTESNAMKLLKETPSSSDEFLAALREDARILREKMKTEEWDEIKQDLLNSPASKGVQDFLDGFYSTQNDKGKYFLPWGHGDRYYNRKYNNWIKGFGFENKLKQIYIELGFDASNQTKVKRLYRIYETASEAWANCASAETVGGMELEYVKKYMTKTYNTFIKLIGSVEQ